MGCLCRASNWSHSSKICVCECVYMRLWLCLCVCKALSDNREQMWVGRWVYVWRACHWLIQSRCLLDHHPSLATTKAALTQTAPLHFRCRKRKQHQLVSWRCGNIRESVSRRLWDPSEFSGGFIDRCSGQRTDDWESQPGHYRYGIFQTAVIKCCGLR